jgi:hypothetical protein
VCLEALFQQLHQRRRRIRLPFGRDVVSKRVRRALDQHAHDRIRVCAADHADHLSKDVHRVRPVGGDALHAADQLIHRSERAVWHGASMPRHATDATLYLRLSSVTGEGTISDLRRIGHVQLSMVEDRFEIQPPVYSASASLKIYRNSRDA